MNTVGEKNGAKQLSYGILNWTGYVECIIKSINIK